MSDTKQIPEREEAIEKLRQSEERFRLLVNGVKDYAIYMLDPKGFVTTWNAGAERIKGYEAEEVLGTHFSRFYPAEDVKAGKPTRALEQAAVKGQYEEEGLRVRKDGSVFRADVLITALYDSAGKQYGFTKVVRDISARRIEEQKFRSFLESAPDAIVIVDESGRIALINTQTEKLFGYGREELLGKPVEVLIPERFRGRHAGHRTVFSGNLRFRPMGAGMELYAVRKDGTEFPVEISLSPIQTDEGTLVSSAIRDITERKEIDAKFQEKERLATLGTTAAVFAHEIGNPLNSLSTALQFARSLLNRSDNQNPLVYEAIDGAYQEIQRLDSLLKDYRSFARPRRLNLEKTDLRQLVEEVLAPAVGGYRASGVRVEIDFQENLPLLPADKEKIKQVIVNLCKNAAEAMPDGGVLICRGYQRDDRVVLEFTDTGVGVPEGIQVFQLFKTTKPSGTGLGLPIVQQIISDHRGTVDYVSAVGKGTTFRICLPIFRADPEIRI